MALTDSGVSTAALAERGTPLSKADRVHAGRELARQWLASFERHLSSGDLGALGALFHSDSYWRDMLAFQWDFRTHTGRDRIVAAWRGALSLHRMTDVRLESSNVAVYDRKGYGESVEAFFSAADSTADHRPGGAGRKAGETSAGHVTGSAGGISVSIPLWAWFALAAAIVVHHLVAHGYLTRERVGRRNRYEVNDRLPLRHPLEREHDIRVLLAPLRQARPGVRS